jgi:hypothetical protein
VVKKCKSVVKMLKTVVKKKQFMSAAQPHGPSLQLMNESALPTSVSHRTTSWLPSCFLPPPLGLSVTLLILAGSDSGGPPTTDGDKCDTYRAVVDLENRS